MQFCPDIFQYGPNAACTLLQFRACRAWITHLKSDKYFSPAQFKEVYAASLPEAQFTRMKTFMGVVWTAPAEEVKKRATNQPGLIFDVRK